MDTLPIVTPSNPGVAVRPVVELFDPPMCCPTGLCGPSLDQTLLDVNDMIVALQTAGVGVARYQMAGDPQIFLRYPEVLRLVRTQQLAALPITLVHGRIVKTGAYPTLQEVRQALDGAAT